MKKKFLLWFRIVAITILLLGAAILAYSYFIEPDRLIIKTVELRVPHWSKDLNGFKIVAVSDIHGGSHTITEEKLRYLTERVNAQNPDIIVLLGDFISERRENKKELRMPVETIAQTIAGMRAKNGVFAVIGNHDWWYNEKKVRAALEMVGIKVLENDAVSFQINNQIVWVIGIEDFWKKEQVKIENVLAKINPQENIIAITHNPDSFDFTPDSISLLLAGHTHGGQVVFPIFGAPFVVAKREHTAGHVIKGNRHLFVTTGVGTSGPPLRFGVPPEIVVITLNAE